MSLFAHNKICYLILIFLFLLHTIIFHINMQTYDNYELYNKGKPWTKGEEKILKTLHYEESLNINKIGKIHGRSVNAIKIKLKKIKYDKLQKDNINITNECEMLKKHNTKLKEENTKLKEEQLLKDEYYIYIKENRCLRCNRKGHIINECKNNLYPNGNKIHEIHESNIKVLNVKEQNKYIKFSVKDYDKCKKYFMLIFDFTELQFELMWHNKLKKENSNMYYIIENDKIYNFYNLRKMDINVNEINNVKNMIFDDLFIIEDHNKCKKYFMEIYNMTDIQFDELYNKYLKSKNEVIFLVYENEIYIYDGNRAKPIEKKTVLYSSIMRIKQNK
jgi:hypothetical protein